MFELQSSREFSPLDEMLPPFYFAYLLCFPVTRGSEGTIRSFLQSSLSALVVERPYLTGNIRQDDSGKARPGHLILDIPEPFEDTKIVFSDLTHPTGGWQETYQQLQAAGMPLNKLDSRKLAPLTAGIGETRKVFSVQANFIEGGLLLATCFHHNFVDAYGASRIIARLSEHCNGSAAVPRTYDRSTNDGMPDVFNVEAIKKSYDYDKLKHDPELWRLNALDWKKKPKDYIPFEWPTFLPSLLPLRDPPVTSTMFSFTSQALADLKKLAKPSDGDAWVSTNDALVAFLWRHVMRARFPWSVSGVQSGKKDESIVVVALDGRKDLSLPPSYIGNCLFHCFTDLPISYIGGRDTALGGIALSIRKTVNNSRKKKVLTDAVALAATIPNCQTIRYGADNLGNDLYTTSWIDLPFYRLNWGMLGRTDFFRIPDRQFESLCCILPPRHGEGVVDVIMSMEDEHGVRLRKDKEFTRFARLVPSLE